MAELKPCPFCGGEAELEHPHSFGVSFEYSGVRCIKCRARIEPILKSFSYSSDELAIEAWNRRTKIETNIYDKEETYPNCTVQVLTNTATGEVSVGWWENGGKEE